MAIADWMNKQQQDLTAYLIEESRILREKLGQKRIILSESQHRAWLVPATALHDGLNRVEVHVHAGAPPARIIFVDLTIL